eukprot:CAMPEP_0201558482 /NCGR_PEP_ID=MMETSP0173_2-20130828/68047_1 /ASSEMBLY_ACC=CAM_ASM_000268 /TAXON_ID=218659 /ORGANISM="Vexillifera sp., Strain DIVA3 564/2" /LENGTH=290 /DNA_ID=CAMNT_0047971899 /DNA_START=23 /DNA_END=895 /DNA_ORIENTATION=-
MKNSYFWVLVILLISNAIVMCGVFVIVGKLNDNAQVMHQQVSSELDAQREDTIEELKTLLLSPDGEELRQRLSNNVGGFVSDKLIENSEQIAHAITNAIWTSVLPENVFDAVNPVLEVNFTVLAKQVQAIAKALAGSFGAQSNWQDAASISNLVGEVAGKVATITPLSSNPNVPIDENNLTLVGNLLDSLPNIFLESAKDIQSWRTMAVNIVILSQRLVQVNWSGYYKDSYGDLEQWNFNEPIRQVASTINTVAVFIMEASYNVQDVTSKPTTLEIQAEMKRLIAERGLN